MRPFQWMEEEPDFYHGIEILTTQKVDIPGVTSFVSASYMDSEHPISWKQDTKPLCACAVVREENSWHESKR